MFLVQPLALLLFTGTLQAEQQTLTLGTRHTLDSQVLGEERSFLVHTPGGYESGGRFPVLYLTDGPGHFLHTAGTLDFLSRNGRIPEMILVAVGNTGRTRDMTPTRAATIRPDGEATDFPMSGGADAFLAFFEKELIPFVEANFRTQPYRVFAGHSFGGLLAVHAFLNHTELFDAYIAVSPSLWWDKGLLTKQAEAFFADKKRLDASLFFSLGSEAGKMRTAFERFREVLEGAGDLPGFSWGSKLMLDEDHGSVVLRSHYFGLLQVFADWPLPRAEGGSGGEVPGGFEGARRHFEKLSKRMGYEIPFPENLANRLGYQELGRERVDAALEIFRFNVQQHPGSTNVYDSLGDGYMAKGKHAQAVESYGKAVELAREQQHANLGVYESNLKRALARQADDS